MRKITITSMLLLSIILASGCYKIDIRQGNHLEQASIDQLRVGMSKTEIQQLLGTPILTDPFNQNRWDYIYTFYPRGNENIGERRHLRLVFQGDTLATIDTSELAQAN